MKMNYGEAIRAGFQYLLKNKPEVFTIGQGLWSPWYVGNSMTDLDKEFGKDRVIDTPVSEAGTTGAAIGASLCGYRPIVIHPRIDFMILATDPIVNQAAKWSHMLGGQIHPAVTIRAIVNRGGQQGAQHSQALQSWFAHVPGLRVVMPATVKDARDLLISSVMCDDPVLYIDDRWLYEQEDDLPEVVEVPLEDIRPQKLMDGKNMTIVGSSYSTKLALDSVKESGLSADVIDLRVLNPMDDTLILESVKKTGRLLVVDGGWKTCGIAGEIIARVSESLPSSTFKATPKRITLPHSPAPTSGPLEQGYYPDVNQVTTLMAEMLGH